MENLLFYFIKVNIILVLFYGVYYLLLRKETFFQANRLFLLGGIVSAFIIPLLSYSQIVFIEPVKIDYEELLPNATYAEEFVSIVEPSSFDWNYFVIVLYSLVVTILLARLTLELYSFFNAIKLENKNKVNKIVLVETTQFENPFSFFNYLVYNKSAFTEEELEYILTHELVHIKQYHSIDVIVGKLVSLVLWINPVAWWYKKAVHQNLEFIADAQTTKELQNTYDYQKTLLKVVNNLNQLSITNQFYQSLIKKRIVMLNTKPSNKRNAWKYSVILPMLVAFFIMYQVKTVAQVRNEKAVVVAVDYNHVVTSTTSDKEIKDLIKAFQSDDILLQITDIKRNKANEIIGIKLAFLENGKTTKIKIYEGNTPMQPIRIFIREDENGTREIGFEDVKDKVIVGNYNTTNEKSEIVTDGQYYTIDKMVKNGKRIPLIIDGRLQKEGTKIAIPTDRKIEIEREITAKEAKEKYNIEAKEGELFYEITTKLENLKSESEKDAVYAVVETEFSENESYNHIEKIKQDTLVDAKKALILLNGKEISYKDLDKINVAEISSSGCLVSSHSIKKYGDKAKNGVIFINTKAYDKDKKKIIKEMFAIVKEENPEKNIKEKKQDKIEKTSYDAGISIQMGNPNVVKMLEDATKSSKINYENALIVLDGKIIDREKLNSVNINGIGKITVKTENPDLISKFGEGAKNGVIFIESISYAKPTLDYENLPDFRLKDGESFTISKKSSNEDLDFYKKMLQKNDCKVNFKNIKRNKKNEITTISILMKKDDIEVKKDIKQSNPIDIIQIGILENKPFIK